MIEAALNLIWGLDAWLRNLKPFEVAMFVMIFWLSATIIAVTLQRIDPAKPTAGAATLMYGSFVMTALMLAFLVYAGVAA